MKTRAIAAQVINPPNQLAVFGIGANRPMYSAIFDNSVQPPVTSWLDLGGQFDSAPATLSEPGLVPSTTDIFCLGLNFAMYHGALSSFGSPPVAPSWKPLGGFFNGPPNVSVVGRKPPGPVFAESWAIVGLDSGNRPVLKFFDGETWYPAGSDWHSLGGALLYEPAIVPGQQSDGARFELFGVGMDRQMYRLTVDANHWPPPQTDWQQLGGYFNSPLAVAKWIPDRVDVFGVGKDFGMYHNARENGKWYGDWESLYGAFNSQPAVVSWGPNRLDIFGLGTDNQMYHKAWDGSQWLPIGNDWEPLGGVFTSAPVAVSTGSDLLHIFGLGNDFGMYHKSWNGGQWLPSSTDWEPLGGVFKVPRP